MPSHSTNQAGLSCALKLETFIDSRFIWKNSKTFIGTETFLIDNKPLQGMPPTECPLGNITHQYNIEVN